MSKYSKLGDLYNSQQLGSFEMHGVSNTFGNQFGGFGQVMQLAGGVTCAGRMLSNRCLDTPIPSLSKDELVRCYGDSASSNCTDTRNRPIAMIYVNELGARGYICKDDPCEPGSRWEKKEKDEGTSAGEVLTGIAAILNPLATAGVGIFQASQQAKLAKLQLKQGGGGGGDQNAALIAALSARNQGGSNTGVIIAVVLVIVIVMAMMFMMMNKKKAGA